jgi:hypothetical protein
VSERRALNDPVSATSSPSPPIWFENRAEGESGDGPALAIPPNLPSSKAMTIDQAMVRDIMVISSRRAAVTARREKRNRHMVPPMVMSHENSVFGEERRAVSRIARVTKLAERAFS